MTAWLVACIGLLPPLLFAVIASGRGAAPARLVGIQVTTAVAVLLAVVLSVLDDQASSLDLALALALALLSLPAALLFALFEERWL